MFEGGEHSDNRIFGCGLAGGLQADIVVSHRQLNSELTKPLPVAPPGPTADLCTAFSEAPTSPALFPIHGSPLKPSYSTIP